VSQQPQRHRFHRRNESDFHSGSDTIAARLFVKSC
jgi:hypothetical protein